jgi:hypothetical protein
MSPSTTARSISLSSLQPGSPQQPIYAGTTIKGRISMTNGHQLTNAVRRPDDTVAAHTIRAPLGRLRLAVYRRPLLRGLALLPPRPATPSPARAPLVPPDQQALGGTFPSPVQLVTVQSTHHEASS